MASKERRELVCACVAVWRVPGQGLSGSGGHRGEAPPRQTVVGEQAGNVEKCQHLYLKELSFYFANGEPSHCFPGSLRGLVPG